jgi:hypothetical protein
MGIRLLTAAQGFSSHGGRATQHRPGQLSNTASAQLPQLRARLMKRRVCTSLSA